MRFCTSSTLGAATFVATFLFAPLAKGFEVRCTALFLCGILHSCAIPSRSILQTYQPYYQRDLARLSLAELLGEFSTRELAELLARARPPVNAQPANTPAAPSEPQATPAGDPFTPPAPLASPNKEDDDLVWKHRFHGEATFRLRPQLVSDLTAAVARIQAACRPIIAAYNKMIKEPGVGRPVSLILQRPWTSHCCRYRSCPGEGCRKMHGSLARPLCNHFTTLTDHSANACVSCDREMRGTNNAWKACGRRGPFPKVCPRLLPLKLNLKLKKRQGPVPDRLR